ncbi:MAG: pyridoxine 5'-phosphate synthase [Pelagibacterales bacterium]|nr:pyridoxine 5'-phosphate synthase [Pelagibacterales bacterium]OUU61206.1 MAG: pyridoxine 5'-phosphate synthase [Alphaproteobacteria bacterium TMED62]|tara:strand:+ start:5714 stop:6421 length:708 start_codon:yes stop_codon:yes gene_type:complete
MRLGVNIDHVATIRNARGGFHPDPIRAAMIAEAAGADLIVAHLREDRRHINEKDISNIIRNINIPLQLEIAPTNYMIKFAIKSKIKKVCIVPEKREELTTEGGLNISYNFNFLKENLLNLFRNDIEVSLFLDPNVENINLSLELGVNAIEFHTGEIANASGSEEMTLIKKFEAVVEYAISKNISIRAGHGLNYEKTKKIINCKNIEEINIGHFIIGESIFYGLSDVIKKMKKIID